MTRAIARTGLYLAAAMASLVASGCYVPGGGWTMRTGLDTRRRHKPSVFLELVDTRWDEYNRMATMNLDSPPVEVNGIVEPGGQPNGPSGITLPAVNGPMVPDAPPVPSNGEPNPLLGTPAEMLPPPPPLPSADGPTARHGTEGACPTNSPAADDAALRAAGDDDLEDGIDDDEDLARRNCNWFQRVSGRLKAKARRPSGTVARTTSEGEKTPLRPSASRLFSPPR
jgi:hypothetical protein